LTDRSVWAYKTRAMPANPDGNGDSGAGPERRNLFAEGVSLHQTAADGLTVRVRRTETYAIVSLNGDLDLRSAGILSDKLTTLEEDGPDVVVLDLRGLRFLDSTGVALTVRAHARARDAGRRLVIVPGPPAVRKPFELAQLESVLEFCDDCDELEEELLAAAD
jgi:anti-anti-sigma factor